MACGRPRDSLLNSMNGKSHNLNQDFGEVKTKNKQKVKQVKFWGKSLYISLVQEKEHVVVNELLRTHNNGDGEATCTGLVSVGDIVVGIDGESVQGHLVDTVADMIALAKRPVVISFKSEATSTASETDDEIENSLVEKRCTNETEPSSNSKLKKSNLLQYDSNSENPTKSQKAASLVTDPAKGNHVQSRKRTRPIRSIGTTSRIASTVEQPAAEKKKLRVEKSQCAAL